jgi:hypothetical protein
MSRLIAIFEAAEERLVSVSGHRQKMDGGIPMSNIVPSRKIKG